MPERYSRHAAPGFHQSALSAPLVLISARELDEVGDAVAARLTAMGVERVVLASRSPMYRDMTAVGRAWRLNPNVIVDNTSIDLARDMTMSFCRSNPSALPYVLVDLSERPDELIAELGRWPAVPTLYYARRDSVVAIGHSPQQTWRHLADRAARGTELSGGQHIFAACHIAADYLAAVRAYESPLDGWMPRARPLASYDAPATSARRDGQTAMLIGGGGALGHALLEAVLADPVLRRSLAGGRIVIVDPDTYAESNLSRQTLAGGVENVSRKKAIVTAEELQRRWPGDDCPRLVSDAQRFQPAMLDWYRPDVVALVADNFAVRSRAFDRARKLDESLVLCAGTEFTYGQARAVIVNRSRTCFDHGPEQLWASARAEETAESQRTSCAREITPSNVLTNAIAGAVLAGEWRRHVAGWRVSPSQTLINWSMPERAMVGPPVPTCDCWPPPEESK
jgi:molybdopterin/thiamine biosynthesis adenylyltransferase